MITLISQAFFKPVISDNIKTKEKYLAEILPDVSLKKESFFKKIWFSFKSLFIKEHETSQRQDKNEKEILKKEL